MAAAYRLAPERVVYRLLPERARAHAGARARWGNVWLAVAVVALVAGAFWMMWSFVFFVTRSPLKGTLLFTFGGCIPLVAGMAALRAARRQSEIAEQLTLFVDGFGGRTIVGADDASLCTPFSEEACHTALADAVDAGAALMVRTDAPPLVPPPGVDRARLVSERAAGQKRARRAGTVALLAFAFAGWWSIIGATGLAEKEYVVAIIVLVFTMVIPAIFAVFALRRARGERAAVRRLVRLGTVVSAHDVRGFDELSEWLACSEPEGRKAALDARSRGVLDERLLATLGGADVPDASPDTHVRRRRRGPLSTVGAVIDQRYEVETLLGQGGMGAVYRVRDRETGTLRALKTMLEDDATLRARFAREARAAQALDHPGIVRVHAIGEEQGLTYLVMDLLEGETLERRLERRGSLPWPEALRIVHEVGEALAAAHDAGLLHRDVKPANVFLARRASGERAVLLDFGLVRKLARDGEGLTADGAAVGTPLYMSPEQARGEPLDARSDLHALGAILHECLTGVPPFFDRTDAAIYARLLAGEVAPLDAPAPPGLDVELRRALAPAARDRHADVRAFLDAIAGLPRQQAI
ncbi:MAG: serine/threonine protein kinase [Myxococcales bacterium]|nr:serine/threonine protein kinase [Myxococcales bacterium]